MRLKSPRILSEPVYIDHAYAKDLQRIGSFLDGQAEVRRLVARDLAAGKAVELGRAGRLCADQLLRIIILKQLRGYSYRDLAFHLADSRTYQAFCRILPGAKIPGKSALQENVGRVRAATLEKVNQIINRSAPRDPRQRIDCTVVATNIHAPTDSSLLDDCVRTMVRLLGQGKRFVKLSYRNSTRRARRLAYRILCSRGANRHRLYLELLECAADTSANAEIAVPKLRRMKAKGAKTLADQLKHYADLTRKVIAQTRRRIVKKQKVPAQQKVVSIFEPHTDIIVKGGRETFYGHKVCVSQSGNGLITDCLIVRGNPTDNTLATEMIDRQLAFYGSVPAQAVFDGAFASHDNLTSIKKLGVADVAFTRSPGISIADMTSTEDLYRQLRRFRAGIEGLISFLKRSVGLSRCTSRGLDGFKRYVWSSVVAANLLALARRRD